MKLGFIIKSLFLISSSFFLYCSENPCDLGIIFKFNTCYYLSSDKIFPSQKQTNDVVFDLNEVFKRFFTPGENIKFENMHIGEHAQFDANIIKGKKLKFPKCYLVNLAAFVKTIKANEKVDFSSLDPLPNTSFDGTKVTIKKTVAQGDDVAIFFTLEIENSNDKVDESKCCSCKKGKKAEENKDNS